MASKTYKIRALVLKKTKLADKDLIVTLLSSDGQAVQGVAKGARKPGGSFAARLELFSTVDVLMAQGRSLDVVCEARLVFGPPELGDALVHSTCSSPVAELLALVAQPGLEQPRLFAMAQAAFGCIAASSGEPDRALSATGAALWKLVSQAGFRPSIATCALCAQPVAYAGSGAKAAFSLADGGAICVNCHRPADAILVDEATLRWCEALIRTRFDDLGDLGMDASASFAVLELAQLWIRAHVGRRLKSLDFLFTSGLF